MEIIDKYAYEDTALFFDLAIKHTLDRQDKSTIKILDFGCGSGKLSQCLSNIGYETYGCDIYAGCARSPEFNKNRLKQIELDPYTLPYDDNTFDIVISTSVLEHALNTEEIFIEVKRILKPGGYAMHMYPSKWYLPTEPHIKVPLVNFLWPNCPKWWLSLWHFLGVKAEIQKHIPWKKLVDLNYKYCQESLCYITNSQYKKLAKNIFSNYSAPMDFYIEHAYGGAAKLAKRLPFKNISGFLIGLFRMNFIIMRKPEK